MAARLEPAPLLDVVDLRHVRAYDMGALLEEEIELWKTALEWDFTKSAELVRRFVDLRALNGCALLRGREVIGYSYYVQEEHKGLVGDVFVRAQFRTPDNEDRLLEWTLGALAESPYVRRIEAQLMMRDSPAGRMVPMAPFATAFERNFMVLEAAAADALAPGAPRTPCFIERWSESCYEQGAQLIAEAYEHHVDSRINDQYRTAAGARRFLYNIVQYPGCGAFFRAGSLAAFEPASHRMTGLCLASIVAPECGHITQICVSPAVRGTGTGYELLRGSIQVLRASGCRRISLTVTASNRRAVALYERVGFRTVRRFSAYAWEGF